MRTFINLPVRDVAKALDFFAGIGLDAGPGTGSGTGSGPGSRSAGPGRLTVADGTVILLHPDERFAGFTGQQPADLGRSREVVIGLAVESRDRVDELTRRAVAAGATSLGDAQDDGFMYMRGFRDLDGHQWSFLHLAG